MNYGSLKVISFNAWSMRNKISDIMSYLVDNKIDLAFIQETWLRKSDGNLLTDIREYGYEVISQRKSRRLDLGGGVALLYIKSLRVQNVKSQNYASFEHIECKVATDKGPMCFVNIYRPEYSSKNRFTVKRFLKDFTELLNGIC